MRIKKYYKLIRVDYEDSEYFRIKNISDTAGVFTITRNGSPSNTDLKYSLDGVNWTTADLSTDFSLEVEAGANVYMKGTNLNGFNRNYSGSKISGYSKMSMDVDHTISGNIMSIVDENNYTTINTIPTGCFAGLFEYDVHLISAENVNVGNVVTIEDEGFYANGDFDRIHSIFIGCTSLIKGIDLSSVTSIGEGGCRNMYRDCTSLTTASDLSNVTSIGGSGCNFMYLNCSSLTTASDLSNVTSIGWQGCYGMYHGCTSLTEATAPNVSTWDTSAFSSWLYNTASTGVVRKPAGLEIPTDDTDGVPSGWTTEDY